MRPIILIAFFTFAAQVFCINNCASSQGNMDPDGFNACQLQSPDQCEMAFQAVIQGAQKIISAKNQGYNQVIHAVLDLVNKVRVNFQAECFDFTTEVAWNLTQNAAEKKQHTDTPVTIYTVDRAQFITQRAINSKIDESTDELLKWLDIPSIDPNLAQKVLQKLWFFEKKILNDESEKLIKSQLRDSTLIPDIQKMKDLCNYYRMILSQSQIVNLVEDFRSMSLHLAKPLERAINRLKRSYQRIETVKEQIDKVVASKSFYELTLSSKSLRNKMQDLEGLLMKVFEYDLPAQFHQYEEEFRKFRNKGRLEQSRLIQILENITKYCDEVLAYLNYPKEYKFNGPQLNFALALGSEDFKIVYIE